MYNDSDTFPHLLIPPHPCSPVHVLTCSPVLSLLSYHHIMIRWCVAIALTSRYFESSYFESRQYIPWCQATLKTRLSCLFIWGECYPFTWHSPGIRGNMISQHPWSIDKHLPDSLNIRCSTRSLLRFASEEHMAMMWADGRVGFNELRIGRLNAGGFGGMALDVVFWGVASLNKVSIVENMGGIGWNVANTWESDGLSPGETISK